VTVGRVAASTDPQICPSLPPIKALRELAAAMLVVCTLTLIAPLETQ